MIYLDNRQFSAVSPHAVIHRPLRYFVREAREDEDNLDVFKGETFLLVQDAPCASDVRTPFEVRAYPGFPYGTVSVYLPEGIVDAEVIATTLRGIFEGFNLPESAITWRRGEEYEVGVVSRKHDDHLTEQDILNIVLRAVANQPSGATADEIINAVEAFYWMAALDEGNDSGWKARVRKALSGEAAAGRNTALYLSERDGYFQMTPDGIDVLRHQGYLHRHFGNQKC